MDEQTSAARTSAGVRVITVKNNVLPIHLERLPVDGKIWSQSSSRTDTSDSSSGVWDETVQVRKALVGSSGASHRIGDQHLTVPADPAGNRQLIAFRRRHGATLWAIDGTGRFGAGLTTALLACCERIVELGHRRPPAGSPDTEASPGTGASPGTLASVAAGTTAAIPIAAGTRAVKPTPAGHHGCHTDCGGHWGGTRVGGNQVGGRSCGVAAVMAGDTAGPVASSTAALASIHTELVEPGSLASLIV